MVASKCSIFSVWMNGLRYVPKRIPLCDWPAAFSFLMPTFPLPPSRLWKIWIPTGFFLLKSYALCYCYIVGRECPNPTSGNLYYPNREGEGRNKLNPSEDALYCFLVIFRMIFHFSRWSKKRPRIECFWGMYFVFFMFCILKEGHFFFLDFGNFGLCFGAFTWWLGIE